MPHTCVTERASLFPPNPFLRSGDERFLKTLYQAQRTQGFFCFNVGSDILATSRLHRYHTATETLIAMNTPLLDTRVASLKLHPLYPLLIEVGQCMGSLPNHGPAWQTVREYLCFSFHAKTITEDQAAFCGSLACRVQELAHPEVRTFFTEIAGESRIRAEILGVSAAFRVLNEHFHRKAPSQPANLVKRNPVLRRARTTRERITKTILQRRWNEK